MKRELIKTDRNGTKYWNTLVPCDRCNGTGIYRWGAIQTGWNGEIVGSTYAGTCFKCGGAAKIWEVQKEYTPEYRAKLDTANEKRKAKQREKWEAENAAYYAEQLRIAEEKRKAAEEVRKAEEARKAISQYVGSVGEQISVTVKLEKEFSFEIPSFKGWGTDTKWIQVFVDADGNKFVWKTTTVLGKVDEKGYWNPICEGDEITIKATVKDHGEYKGEKQTELQRVKLVG